MSKNKGNRRRYKKRYSVHFFQNVERFEGNLNRHRGQAVSVIQRIRDDGREYFKGDKDNGRIESWEEYCDGLICVLKDLDLRKQQGQELSTVMREYFQEFEHSSGRLDQMLHGVTHDRGDDDVVVELWLLLTYAFRVSIYGIVAEWTPDKKEVEHIDMHVNLSTGLSKTTCFIEKGETPKKYKHATKRF